MGKAKSMDQAMHAPIVLGIRYLTCEGWMVSIINTAKISINRRVVKSKYETNRRVVESKYLMMRPQHSLCHSHFQTSELNAPRPRHAALALPQPSADQSGISSRL